MAESDASPYAEAPFPFQKKRRKHRRGKRGGKKHRDRLRNTLPVPDPLVGLKLRARLLLGRTP